MPLTSMVNPDSNLFRYFNSDEVPQNPKYRTVISKLVSNTKSSLNAYTESLSWFKSSMTIFLMETKNA